MTALLCVAHRGHLCPQLWDKDARSEIMWKGLLALRSADRRANRTELSEPPDIILGFK